MHTLSVADYEYPLPKTRYEIRIAENGEPLVPIPLEGPFVFQDPHPYQALGAPYQGATPFVLRSSVLARLESAAAELSRRHSGFRLKIYDAYRPLEVQAFMVEKVAAEYCQRVANVMLAEADNDLLMLAYDRAHELWAPPTDNPYVPPPHSTGAAVDLTIVDASGNELDTGSPIDEYENSHPEAFALGRDEKERLWHTNRELLREVMEHADFVRLPNEWWHFSFGDQQYVLDRLKSGKISREAAVAIYGRVGATYPPRHR